MADPEQQNLNSPAPNQPVFKERLNKTDIAIWKNERGYSIALQKSYKKRDTDEWTRMKVSFFPDEIDSAIALMTKAKEYLQNEGIKTYRVEQG